MLTELPEASIPGAGRPHVPVDIDTGGPVTCGVHIALTHTTLALVNLRGQVVARDRIPHPAPPSPGAVLTAIVTRLPGFLTLSMGVPGARAGRRVLGIGVATGGWVDSDAGVIVEHSLLGWRDVRVRDTLQRRTGLPVHMDGHSRALARAEQLFGDHRARSSVVHLFAGNVVDAAFAVGDAVQHGPRSAAGSIAHLRLPGREDPCVCGRSGCLQAAVSESVLATRAVRAGIISEPYFPRLLAAATAGDPRAGAMFRQRARAVGTAVAVLLDLLNPEVLVVVEAGSMLLPGCLEVLRAEVRRASLTSGEPPVVATSFGRDVLHVAAGSVALSEVYAAPLAT